MKLVLLQSGHGDYFVVPDRVTWLQVWGADETRIGILGGEPIVVDGTPSEVGLRLQGRR